MPIELDKGHDEPIFSPEGKPNMTERFRLAREIAREFGGRAKRLAAPAQGSDDTLAQRRLRAIRQVAGSMPGVWEPGDLDRLRSEWR